MIQLASDPNASRTQWRPAESDGTAPPLADSRSRTGHAWPFISRYAAKPAASEPPRKPAADQGS